MLGKEAFSEVGVGKLKVFFFFLFILRTCLPGTLQKHLQCQSVQ